MDLSLDTPEAPTADSSKSGNKYPNVDFGVKCPVYEELGECRCVSFMIDGEFVCKADLMLVAIVIFLCWHLKIWL